MAAKKVPVIYEQKRKLVNVDFSNYESVIIGIRHRLGITGDVTLFGKRNEAEEFFDIDDDEDLEALEDASAPVLLVKSGSRSHPTPSYQGFQSKSRSGFDEHDFQTHPGPSHAVPQGGMAGRSSGPAQAMPIDEDPPEYEESIRSTASRPAQAPRSQRTASSQAKTTVIFGQKTKQLTVDRTNFETIRSTIERRFQISADFQLQVKSNSGDMIDIDGDDDIEDNLESMDTIWVTLATDMQVSRPSEVDTMAIVKMSGEVYSVTETPRQDSALVLQVSENLKRDVSIPSISAKLDEVEQCLRIAYYSTTGNRQLHKQAQDMQFDVQKICAQCDTTMLRIKLKCGDILNELQCGFGYLLEGFEDFGIERLGAAGPIAAEIQAAAKSLTDLLQTHPQSVLDSRNAVAGMDDEETMKRKQRQMLAERDVRAGKVKQKRDAVRQSESAMQRLGDRERSALDSTNESLQKCSGFGFGLKKLLTFGLYKGDMPRAEQKERLAKDMRLEQTREREKLEQLREEELKARIEFERFVAGMESQPKQMSEASLQGARSGIKTLNSFLQSLAKFWKDNSAEFESISNTAFIDQLKKLEGDAETRKNFWKSKVFKIEALKYIARFVAIQGMCDDFHDTMVRVLDDIHRCIRDNPTPEEAREKLPHLMEEFKERSHMLMLREREEYGDEPADVEMIDD